jgi:hypothetical protein
MMRTSLESVEKKRGCGLKVASCGRSECWGKELLSKRIGKETGCEGDK